MIIKKQPKILPPPPPDEIPLNVLPLKIVPLKESPVMEIVKPKASPAISPRPGSRGKRVCLLTNLFKVTMATAIDDFYHYDVRLSFLKR